MNMGDSRATLIATIGLAGILASGGALAQRGGSSRVVDDALGVAFTPMGRAEKSDGSTCVMSRLSADAPDALAAAPATSPL